MKRKKVQTRIKTKARLTPWPFLYTLDEGGLHKNVPAWRVRLTPRAVQRARKNLKKKLAGTL